VRPAPGVYPRDSVRPTSSVAERSVWRALRDRLPAGWYAWHSLRLRDRRASFGEGDFVLAHPERGILLLEVKGGAIAQRDGTWFQNGRPLAKAPLDQAHGFRALLLGRLRAAGVDTPSIGQAPCFPDTDFDAQPTEDDLAGIVMGAHHLRWLAEALPAIAARAIPPPRPTSRGDWIEALHRMWGETWVPSLSLGTRAREQAERRLALDEAQLEVLDGLLENDRVLVQGGAGSGKTLLAAEAARRLAASGGKVLLLCFTAPLRKWLAARLEGTGVEVQTVSGFAKRIADETGPAEDLQQLSNAEAWGQVFERAAKESTPAFDAVVVDEAQDLQREAWHLVEVLAKERRLWALFDPGQGFWADRSPPPALFATRFRLPRQQRCPAGVQALANRILGQPFDAGAIAKAREDGTFRTALVAADAASVAAGVDGAVRDLLAGGLAVHDLGIVSLRGRAAHAGEGLPRVAGHEAVPADAPEMEERLVVDSFLRWKGLERPGIVVTDLPEDELTRLPIRLNVALTRATVAVRVVGSAAALARLELG
jgi:nuclease-like protein/AAA domain-containing protein